MAIGGTLSLVRFPIDGEQKCQLVAGVHASGSCTDADEDGQNHSGEDKGAENEEHKAKEEERKAKEARRTAIAPESADGEMGIRTIVPMPGVRLRCTVDT